MATLKKIINKTKGFTLIEAVVAIVITSIILSPLCALYYNTQKDSIIAQRKIATQYELKKAIDVIIEDSRKVESQYINDDTAKPTIEVSNKKKIAFRYPDSTYPSGIKQITYCKSGNKILKYVGSFEALDSLTPTPSTIFNGDRILCESVAFKIYTLVASVEGDFSYDKINDGIIGGMDKVMIELRAQPKKVGNTVLPEIKQEGNLFPRFNMDNR